MNNEYTIVPVKNKKLHGLSVSLTKSQNHNYIIISDFWKKFNTKLHFSDLPKQAGGNREKYGITYKTGDIYKYFCGISDENEYINNIFEEYKISEGNYAIFQHKGAMYNLKDTLFRIYKKNCNRSPV
jgi:predicted transcriptional regulator YdeE